MHLFLKQRSSFTLIELLVVIGILAILTTAVVIVLNPSQLLKQARDATRASDLASLTHAINLLQSQVDASLGTASTVYVSVPDTSATCVNLSLPTLPAGYTYHCVTQANLRNINSTGWLPVDFTQSPIQNLSALPLDPINTTSTNLYYTYIPGGSYELTALMESDKGSLPAQSDGGTFPGVLEQGTHKGLTPPLRDRGLVGYWPLDEGTGTTTRDASGNNNTGTLTNGPTWQSGASCKKGGCLSFVGEGNNQYVSCGANLKVTSSQYTVSGWVKIPSTVPGSSRHVMVQIGSSYPTVSPSYSTTQRPLIYLNGSNYRYGSSNVRNDQWSFFSFVVFGNQTNDILNAKIYLNGILELSGATTNSEPPISPNGSCFIGSAYFDGLIDDVRVYNRALSAAEILSIYNATK